MNTTTHKAPGGLPLTLLGAFNVFFGGLLAAGGLWLISLGGTLYYALAGLGIGISGVLLTRRSMSAVWLYAVVWLGTVFWAFSEVGFDWWAQIPRLLLPTVLMLLMLLCIPPLKTPQAKRS